MSQPEQSRAANDDASKPQSFELSMRNETLHVPGIEPLDSTMLLKRADHVALESDLEGQPKDRDERSGWFGLARQQRRDIRHMVAPRYTEIHSYCVNNVGNRLSSVYAAVQRTHEAGEEVPELNEKLEQTMMRYGQMVCQTQQMLALGQPSNRFMRNFVPVVRARLQNEDTSFLDEPLDDWASLSLQDRLDQLITLIPTTTIGRVLAKPFRSNTEEIGENALDDYHEEAMKFALFTIFSLILGVFTCAPAGIQSLNVVSVVGEVAVYVAFVIVFGWLSLGLLRGFEKSLLSSLAFAALMATLLRGNN
ncbi:hypothetical protein ACLX1H_006638 [Fusarium chlamydosporum]